MNREGKDDTVDQGYGSTPREVKLKGRRYLIMIRQDGTDHVGYWPVVRDGGKLVVSDSHPAPGHPSPAQRGHDYLISPVHSHPKALEVQKELQTLDNVFDEVETMVNRLKLGDRWGRNVKQSHLPVMIPRVKSRTPEGFHQGSANHASDYERLLVKIKHALNMLGRLREYIMQPNAPELVHTLFSLLAALKVHNGVIERTAPLVLEPMLTPAATKLLQNCLSSREMQLWQSLGSAWTTPSEGAVGHKPEMYASPWHYNDRIERPTPQLQRPSPRPTRRRGSKDDVLFDYHDETSSEDQSTGVHTVTKNFGEKFSTIGSDYYSRQSSTTHSLASLSLDDEDDEEDRRWRRWKVDPKTFEAREPDTDSVATDSSWTAVWINTDKQSAARPKRENWNHYKSPESVVADLKHKNRSSLDKSYSAKEVAKWMKKHGFSRSSIDAFQGLDAERLHGLTKREMEIVCPEEGARLYNLIAG
ncbi:epidermal growth factor receptor kinase substrate 8-like protein 1 isoform X3 [Branchiostoma floridae x Branchiostoma japonicum]